MPSTPPSSNAHKSDASEYGLSLLDGSPAPGDASDEDSEPKLATGTSPSYENLLQQATLWKSELESMRDSIYFLQVQNCQSLDALFMAGADIPNNCSSNNKNNNCSTSSSSENSSP